MKKLAVLESLVPSANFGQVVNGRTNRVLSAVWKDKSDSLIQFVGDGEQYQGNLVLPDNFSLEQLQAYKQAVQKAVDDGKVDVFAYSWPVSVITDGKFKELQNVAKPNTTPMQSIRRAWPRENDESYFALVKAQVVKSIEAGKLKGIA